MYQESLYPSRNRRVELNRFPESGMDERQAGGVQGVAVQPNRRSQARLAIYLVAHDRMAERGEMHTDLVSPPGLQVQFQEGEVGEALEHAIAGDRSLATSGWSDRHLHAVPRVSANRRVDDAFGGADTAVNDRKI